MTPSWMVGVFTSAARFAAGAAAGWATTPDCPPVPLTAPPLVLSPPKLAAWLRQAEPVAGLKSRGRRGAKAKTASGHPRTVARPGRKKLFDHDPLILSTHSCARGFAGCGARHKVRSGPTSVLSICPISIVSRIFSRASNALSSSGSGASSSSGLSVERMRELQPRRVQKIPAQPEPFRLRLPPRALTGPPRSHLVRQLARAAIQRVAHHRVPDGSHVHANLVRAAGLNAHPHQREPAEARVEPLDHLVVRDGRAAHFR